MDKIIHPHNQALIPGTNPETTTPTNGNCDSSKDDWDCCTSFDPCGVGEGDCDSDTDCIGDLICGYNNCQSLDSGWNYYDFDCCITGKHCTKYSFLTIEKKK